MKSHTRSGLITLAIFAIVHVQSFTTFAQGTAFTYQGSLNNSGAPANGSYDLAFALYATNVTGSAIAGPVTNSAVAVSNGLFTTTVDFGPNVFTGGSNWLQLSVSTNGANAFSALTPRQQLTPVPYAIFANTASNFSGTIANGQLANSSITVNAGAGLGGGGTVVLGGSITLNNNGVLSVSANAPLSSSGGQNPVISLTGTVPSATNFTGSLAGDVTGTQGTTVVTPNIPRLNGTNVFTGTNAFAGVVVATNAGNVFAGSGANLTSLNASQLTSGTIPVAQLSVVVITNGETGVSLAMNNLLVTGTNQIAPLTVPPNIPSAAIGSVAAGSGAQSVVVSGRYAYVADTTANTLKIIDVSSPTNPVSVGSVGTGTQPYCVAVAGRYAYVVNFGSSVSSGSLQIFDVGNPSSPVNVGSVYISRYADCVAVLGRYAYVVENGPGNSLQIFDVGNPSNPVSVSSVGTDPDAYWVTVSGSYAYVGYNGGLQIFDVRNPSSPVSVGSVANGYANVGVSVSGRYAYVVNEGGLLQVVDASNPASPAIVGSANTSTGSYGVAVAGRYAYVATYSPGNSLQIVDVSSPTNPVSVGSVGPAANPISVAVSGRYAYTVGDNTLEVFDLGGEYVQQLEAGAVEVGSLQARDTVAVGNNLDVRGGLTVSASARITGGLGADSITATNISGNFNGSGAGLTSLNASQLTSGTIPVAQLPPAVVTNGETGLSLTMNHLAVAGTNQVAPLSVTPSAVVSPDGILQTLSYPVSVAVAGRYAYVANEGYQSTIGNVQIVDVSNPGSPVTMATLTDANSPDSIAVAGRYAYVANGSGSLLILDVSNPSSPATEATLNGFNNGPVCVAVAGRYAYVVNYSGNSLQIADVNNPTNPMIVGTLPGLNNPESVVVSGRYAYVANYSGNSLQIVDVSNPGSPASVVTLTGFSSPRSVAVSGRYAYVANGGGGLQIVDVSNPVSPVIVGTLTTGLSAPEYVTVSGRYAYVVNGLSSVVSLVDVSNPGSPVIVGSLTTGGDNNLAAVAVSGRYAYMVADNAAYNTGNLETFDLGGAYIQQFEAGAAEVGTLQTRDAVTVGNDLDVRGGLTVSASARITGGLGADSITATNISGNFNGSGAGLTSLNASQLTSGTIPLAQLPPAVVTNNETGIILSGTLTNAFITNSVFAGNGAGLTNLNASQLSSGIVPLAQLPSQVITNGGSMTGTFSGSGSGLTNVWQTGGNSGTTPGANYLGTSDNQALELHVDGGRVLRLEPTVSGTGVPNVIGGWSGNLEDNNSQGVTIGGGGASGYVNHVSAPLGTIAGGSGNLINTNANDSTIGGGRQNTIDLNSWGGVIGGGHGNYIQGGNAGGGGLGNTSYSVIGGGYGNVVGVNVNNATISGGGINTNSGNYATIPGGYENLASGAYSFAAGQNAQATNTGAFVWSDDSAGSVFVSTNNNSFNARAAGGFQFYTSSSGRGGAGLYVAPGGNSWVTISDRNAKKDFAPVNYQAVLDKLAQVPVEQWHYLWESDKDTLNIGPMAQDFVHAFYPGRDDKGISTLEFDGVELAAIQGLNQKLSEKDSEIQTLKQQNDQLAQRLNELEAAVKLLAERK